MAGGDVVTARKKPFDSVAALQSFAAIFQVDGDADRRSIALRLVERVRRLEVALLAAADALDEAADSITYDEIRHTAFAAASSARAALDKENL